MKPKIPLAVPSLTPSERHYLLNAFDSGWISSIGSYVYKTEELLASTFGTKHALLVSNGTTALHLLLESYGFPPNSEVIVPNLTFVATASAVVNAGLKPVFADLSTHNLTISDDTVRPLVNDNTSAVIPVHLYGQVAPIPSITRFCESRGITVIEDAAEAHGAKLGDLPVCSMGDSAFLSFYGNKILTCGEGGAILTSNTELYQRASYLRDHAMSPTKRYWHDSVGFNYRLTNIQAAILYSQLLRLDDILQKRRLLFNRYLLNLSSVPNLKLYPLSTPSEQRAPWLFYLELLGPLAHQRDQTISLLSQQGVESRPYFYPLSEMPPYYSPNVLPLSTRASYSGINLPLYPDLQLSDVDRICETLSDIVSVFT